MLLARRSSPASVTMLSRPAVRGQSDGALQLWQGIHNDFANSISGTNTLVATDRTIEWSAKHSSHACTLRLIQPTGDGAASTTDLRRHVTRAVINSQIPCNRVLNRKECEYGCRHDRKFAHLTVQRCTVHYADFQIMPRQCTSPFQTGLCRGAISA